MGEAKLAGYNALTDAYIPKEYYMMDRVIHDMEKGPIDYTLVAEDDKRPNDLCVYRKGIAEL